MQLLKANGCTVIGMDLDPGRVAQVRERGLDAPARAIPRSSKSQVRDMTNGQGADRTISDGGPPGPTRSSIWRWRSPAAAASSSSSATCH